MKKIYQKPAVMIEDYMVAEMIAAGCEQKYLMGSINHCTNNPGMIDDAIDAQEQFLDANSCLNPITVDAEDGICYHGSADNNLLAS